MKRSLKILQDLTFTGLVKKKADDFIRCFYLFLSCEDSARFITKINLMNEPFIK
jgi:hypothetical protein